MGCGWGMGEKLGPGKRYGTNLGKDSLITCTLAELIINREIEDFEHSRCFT